MSRSIIFKLDEISKKDIVHVELPRAIPLYYNLDPETLKPIPMHDAAAHLSGRYVFGFSYGYNVFSGRICVILTRIFLRYLADKGHLAKIMARDHKQVYDLDTKENLEMTSPLTGFSL